MIDIICAICGKNQQVELLYPANFKESDLSSHTYSARRLPDRIHYRTLKCKNCGLIFASPILPNSKIMSLYKKSFCSYDEQVPYTIKTYLDLFKRIYKDIPNNPKVLDIGCGNGFFLDGLRKIGVSNVYGVEPSLKMANEVPRKFRKDIKVNIFKPNLFPKNYFDVACCFHTLDHVVDPNEFIGVTWDILLPGGYALFVVHNTDSLFAKIFGEKWPIFDIEHIYIFNNNTLNSLFLKHKFKNIKTFNVNNVYPLSYYAKMSPFSMNTKNVLRNIISRFRLSNLKIPLPSGNIGIIAQKK
jgi:SAM-dependent methyltransferase